MMPEVGGAEHLVIFLRVLELEMLEQAALRAVAAVAPLGVAVIALLNLVVGPPKALLALRSLFPHFVPKLLLRALLHKKGCT